MPVVQRWAATFLPRPHSAAAGALPPPPPAPLPETENRAQRARAFEAAGLPSGPLRVARVLATEQQLVSHTYGLKGTVDVVLGADVLSAGPHGTPTHSVPVPLELKTGKRSQYNAHDHMAQARSTRWHGPDPTPRPHPATASPPRLHSEQGPCPLAHFPCLPCLPNAPC